ncbi:hypothetical protein BU23DRAFT_575918 [Bimuria novae-zelandiae CBS 107.79]|uniref:Uncharacterized protein n=1 Tax=Bimuria novae-zelandiae CBS 107.79 TaxID=1447943 RepID=A0A6A5UJK1_9PLEO|nr:hypothetical protein BU23DRAFT_575918 [Bimuria novae-zelandiae CBS 107.79]
MFQQQFHYIHQQIRLGARMRRYYRKARFRRRCIQAKYWRSHLFHPFNNADSSTLPSSNLPRSFEFAPFKDSISAFLQSEPGFMEFWKSRLQQAFDEGVVQGFAPGYLQGCADTQWKERELLMQVRVQGLSESFRERVECGYQAGWNFGEQDHYLGQQRNLFPLKEGYEGLEEGDQDENKMKLLRELAINGDDRRFAQELKNLEIASYRKGVIKDLEVRKAYQLGHEKGYLEAREDIKLGYQDANN